ncbi:MAG: HRDC domain-containing protein [Phycisphaerae bacterium]
MQETTTISRQEQLDETCRQCRVEGRFAFDTEFVMEDRFEAEVCLIQVATEASVTVIDPFLDLDLRSLWALVCDKEVETVVHAGQEDLGLCVQHTGQIPQQVYDVQIAAGLTGYDYPLSLQKLVQTALHIHLHKSKTLTDWRKRPLAADQIRYAAEDVSHLLAVRRKLHERLSKRNRLDWAREEFARFEEMSLYRRAEEDKLLRVKGSGALKGRSLAIVHELLTWREELAKQRNRPVRVALRDHLLVEIAKFELCSFKAVRALRGLNLSDRDIRGLCRVVEKAVNLPSEQWPVLTPRTIETPKEAALIALVGAVLRSYCLEHDIAYGLMASKRSIHKLVRYCTKGRPARRGDVELLTGWRGRTVGAMLEGILAGQRSIQVESFDGERFVRVTPVE